jgi:dipeptidyl aminopeptidase/acylaminoacyl peptidase
MVAHSLLIAVLALAAGPPAPRRNLQVDDLFRLKTVADPQVSADGRWVAYTVATSSLKEDETETQVWMAPVDGGEPLPMTARGTSASRPRFSPDGKYLAFLAARPDEGESKEDAKSQVWLLDRRGGEAQRLTEIAQGVTGFEWAPGGQRLALLVKDPSPEELEAQKLKEAGTKPVRPKAPPVSVIDRLQFKRDYEGYLDRRRIHLYVFDLATKSRPR